jgi:hypothetical protein
MKHPATFTNNQDIADVVAKARAQGCLVAGPDVYRRPDQQHDDGGLGRALQQQQPHYVAFSAYLLTAAAIREYICSAANRTVLATNIILERGLVVLSPTSTPDAVEDVSMMCQNLSSNTRKNDWSAIQTRVGTGSGKKKQLVLLY